MKNGKTVTVNLSRADYGKIMLAVTHIKLDFMVEAFNAKTDEERNVANRTADMWGDLLDMLGKKLADFNEKNKKQISRRAKTQRRKI